MKKQNKPILLKEYIDWLLILIELNKQKKCKNGIKYFQSCLDNVYIYLNDMKNIINHKD